MTTRASTPRWAALRFGFGMLCAQYLPTMAVLTGKPRLMAQWDSHWYRSIIEHGYVSTIPPQYQHHDTSNVAFFPGYPAWAYLFKFVFHLNEYTALVASALVACLVFWIYFSRLFQELGFTPNQTLIAAALLAISPGALFLYAAYSETVFMAATAGYLYWCVRGLREPKHFVLAALHGIVLTGTRLFGPFIALFPLLPFLLNPKRIRLERGDFARAIGVFTLSLGGVLGFFLYCHLKFGHWDLYFQTVAIGWGGNIHSWNALDPRLFLGSLAISADFPNETGRIFMILTWAWAIILFRHAGLTGLRQKTGLAATLALALSVFAATTFLTGVGQWIGMNRYLLPVHFLLLPASLSWLLGVRASTWSSPRLRYGLLLSILVLYAIQIRYVLRFSTGLWVG